MVRGLQIRSLRVEKGKAEMRQHTTWTTIWLAAILTIGCGESADVGPALLGELTERQEAATQLPAKFDWRANGGNFTTVAKDQGNCGSCWAFGIVGSLEARLEIARKDPSANPNLAEQQLVSCSPCNCIGCEDITPVLDWMKGVKGVAQEADFAYKGSNLAACSSAKTGWEGRASPLKGWKEITLDNDSLKKNILEGPIVVKFNHFGDFNSYTSGIYEHKWGAKSGYHYMTVAGWNDGESCWIVKNSWGPDFGEDTYGVTGSAGWLRVKYNQPDLMTRAFALEVEGPAGSDPNPPGGTDPTPGTNNPPDPSVPAAPIDPGTPSTETPGSSGNAAPSTSQGASPASTVFTGSCATLPLSDLSSLGLLLAGLFLLLRPRSRG